MFTNNSPINANGINDSSGPNGLNLTVLNEFSLVVLAENRFLYIFLIVSGIPAIITNLFVILCIIKGQNLHNKCFLFIANLALADFLCGIEGISGGANRLVRHLTGTPETNTTVNCLLELLLQIFSYRASMSLTLTITIDRFIAVCFPTVYKMKLGTTYIVLMLLIFWLDAAAVTAAFFIDVQYQQIVPICDVPYVTNPVILNVVQRKTLAMNIAVIALYTITIIVLEANVLKAKRAAHGNVAEIKKKLQAKVTFLFGTLEGEHTL